MNLKQSLMVCGAFLALTNGVVSAQTTATKTAKVYTVADAHLDTQWNWDVQTTIKEYVWNTLNQNLLLLKQYPNYIFNFEGGVKYAWKTYTQEQLKELDQINDRYKVCLDEGILSPGIRIVEGVHQRRTLAHFR